MENISSTRGSHSRHAGTRKLTRTPVTCEAGLTSENAVSKSSGCSANAYTAKIAKLVSFKLLISEEKILSEEKEPTTEEKIIIRRLFKTVKGLIENNFIWSLDILYESSIDKNGLKSNLKVNTNPTFQCKEPTKKKERK